MNLDIWYQILLWGSFRVLFEMFLWPIAVRSRFASPSRIRIPAFWKETFVTPLVLIYDSDSTVSLTLICDFCDTAYPYYDMNLWILYLVEESQDSINSDQSVVNVSFERLQRVCDLRDPSDLKYVYVGIRDVVVILSFPFFFVYTRSISFVHL